MFARPAVLLTPPRSSAFLDQLLSYKHSSPVSIFRINTYRRPTSIDSKELVEHLNPLDATLTKKTGEGLPNRPRPLTSTPNSSPLFIQPLYFHCLADFFSLTKRRASLFSSRSELFSKTPGGGGSRVRRMKRRETPGRRPLRRTGVYRERASLRLRIFNFAGPLFFLKFLWFLPIRPSCIPNQRMAVREPAAPLSSIPTWIFASGRGPGWHATGGGESCHLRVSFISLRIF